MGVLHEHILKSIFSVLRAGSQVGLRDSDKNNFGTKGRGFSSFRYLKDTTVLYIYINIDGVNIF